MWVVGTRWGPAIIWKEPRGAPNPRGVSRGQHHQEEGVTSQDQKRRVPQIHLRAGVWKPRGSLEGAAEFPTLVSRGPGGA